MRLIGEFIEKYEYLLSTNERVEKADGEGLRKARKNDISRFLGKLELNRYIYFKLKKMIYGGDQGFYCFNS